MTLIEQKWSVDGIGRADATATPERKETTLWDIEAGLEWMV